MQRAIAIQTQLADSRPLGWYTGRCSPQTRKLVVAEGGFLYDADTMPIAMRMTCPTGCMTMAARIW